MSLSAPPHIVLMTLLSGLAGALVFLALGLPSPWLSGAMVGIVVQMAAGFRPTFPEPLRDVGMLLAGVVTGSSITPEMLAVLGHYPLSLGFLVVTTVLVVLAGAFMLRRWFGWDAHSAFFASVPGALSVVVASVAEIGGNMAQVVAAQAFRLFILVALLPSLVLRFVSVAPVVPGQPLDAAAFAVMAFSGLAAALVLLRLRVMAPWFLGGMLAAGAMHLFFRIKGAPPDAVGNLAMLLVGIFAASRMVGTQLSVLRSLWLPCLLLFLSSTLIALAGGYLAHLTTGVPLANALVAFAPGGLEAMVVLGLSLGLDPLYVTSHHVARFLMLAIALPFASRRVPGA